MKHQNSYDIGDWLIEKSHQDPVVTQEVTSRIAELSQPADELSRKLGFLKSELEKNLTQQKNFSEIVNDFDVKLGKMEDAAWKLKPISAIYSTARGQNEEFRPIFREVHNVKKVYDSIFERKEGVEREVDTVSPEEAAALKRFPELERRWKVIWDTVTKYRSQMTSVLPSEEKCHYVAMKFAPWLENAEEKVKQLDKRPMSKQDEIEEANSEIRVSPFAFTFDNTFPYLCYLHIGKFRRERIQITSKFSLKP